MASWIWLSPRRCNSCWTTRSRTAPKIVVDLSGCEFIDSTGIALIVLAFREVGEVKLSMGLCGLHGQVLRVLELSGIPDYIPTRDDREQALAALSAT